MKNEVKGKRPVNTGLIAGCVVLVLILILAVAAIVATNASNSSAKSNATAKGASVAKQAVALLDDYLDGGDFETVKDGLDDLYDEMDYVDTMPTDTSEESRQHTADLCISLILATARVQLIEDNYNGDYETYAEILEQRNELAQYAGIDER